MTTQPDHLDSVDTAPPDAYLDDPAAFAADADDLPGPPELDEDEPWDEFDPDAIEELDGPVSFGPVVLEDTSSFERWLQSGLKALVAPDLQVDGRLGPATRVAIKMFQKRAPGLRAGAPRLGVDGIAGAMTIAELELQTGATAPREREGERAAAPPGGEDATVIADVRAAGTLTVTEQDVDGRPGFAVSDGRQTVYFSYMPGSKYRAHSVSRYKGARKGFVSDADLAAAGYSKSEIGILWANAAKESRGAFGAINTWDNQIVSWGMAQFAGRAGALAGLLADLKDDPRSKDAYDRCFAANGVDVAYGVYPFKGETRSGWHVVVAAPGGPRRGDDGWEYIRTQPRLLGAFMLAGNDPSLAIGQCLFWRRAFLLSALRRKIGKKPGQGLPVRRYLTSERGLAIIVRLNNWMPKYVAEWSARFLAELQARHAGVDVYDPAAWDRVPGLEDEFVQMIVDERGRVKKHGYGDYALDLGRARGSFVGSAAV